ncbi:MAG: hypothetical protein KBD31_04325 [Proteobacteria bacterium]|nr:hypothetical protein [Pseudomonadota bacterium]
MRQYNFAQTAYAQPSYTPPFQQPYGGRSFGPVWSNVEVYDDFRNMPSQNMHSMPNQAAAYHPHNQVYAEQSFIKEDAIPSFLNQNHTHDKRSTSIKKEKQSITLQAFYDQWIGLFYKNWIKEELYFSMNKISLAGLFFGLMFLGSVFFMIGFLVAVNLYGHKSQPQQPVEMRSVMPSQGAMISGRTNQGMNATAYPSGMVQPMPNGPLTNSGHMPTSLQNQGIVTSSLSKGRQPSFHNTIR